MEGWIKLHRKLLDWEWYDQPATKAVFIDLLLNAAHDGREWHGKPLQRGELVTSINQLAARNGLTTQEVRTAINRLIKTGEISKRSTNQNTLILVVKYTDYQANLNDLTTSEQQTNNKQITSKQQTDNKRITTNKKVRSKELKNIYTTTTDMCDLEFAKFTEEERNTEWLDSGLSIAEYLTLCDLIPDCDYLSAKIDKVKKYPKVKSRYKTLIEWAKEDGKLTEGQK